MMHLQPVDYSLYLATDRKILGNRSLCDVVEKAIAGGVTVVQLREKTFSAGEIFRIGKKLLAMTRYYGIPLIINDRVDLMLALDADGVHVGRDDLPLAETRRLAGPEKLVGYSVNRPEHLAYAIANGVDYVGVGPVFPTGTKTDAASVIGLEGVAELTAASPVPCVGIGGINVTRCHDVIAAGATGVCVISAILGAEDPKAAAMAMRRALGKKNSLQ